MLALRAVDTVGDVEVPSCASYISIRAHGLVFLAQLAQQALCRSTPPNGVGEGVGEGAGEGAGVGAGAGAGAKRVVFCAKTGRTCPSGGPIRLVGQPAAYKSTTEAARAPPRA